MSEAQIAVLSGILLLAAIALFIFIGFLWGQRRTRQNGVYVNRDPEQEHDIEIAPYRFREAEGDTAQPEQSTTAPDRDDQPAETSLVEASPVKAEPIEAKPVETTATQPTSTAFTMLETMSSTDLKVKSKLYHYIAHVTAVYDGDTIAVDIDMGMGIWQRDMRIRLWRVNTSEVRGEEREQGLKTRDFVRSLILDRDILLRTILDKRGQDRTGKYGRLLGEVLVEDESGRMLNINKLLLEKGLATPVADDGSNAVTPAAAPQPQDLESVGAQNVKAVVCIYCGEMRAIDFATSIISTCPNCLDDEYTLSSNVVQSVE